MLGCDPVAVVPLEPLLQQERVAKPPATARYTAGRLPITVTDSGSMWKSAPPSKVPAARDTKGITSRYNFCSDMTRVTLPTSATALIATPAITIQVNVDATNLRQPYATATLAQRRTRQSRTGRMRRATPPAREGPHLEFGQET
jgi:hypothetical protein